jgi:hypothetical protein
MSKYQEVKESLISMLEKLYDLLQLDIINDSIKKLIEIDIKDMKRNIDLMHKAHFILNVSYDPDFDDEPGYDEVDIYHFQMNKEICINALSVYKQNFNAIKSFIDREHAVIEELKAFYVEPIIVKNIINVINYSDKDLTTEKQRFRDLDYPIDQYDCDDCDDCKDEPYSLNTKAYLF